MLALKANGVCRKYAKQRVLEGFSIELQNGAFEALMGPSGCGKSTFLNLAAGLARPDAGEIFVGGTEISAMKDFAVAKFRRRHIGVVFQDFNLLNSMSVRENIFLPLKLDGARNDPAAAARFPGLVEALELGDKLLAMPEELSGGERQRVAIARALIAAPDIILADEPTGNLDVKSSRIICQMLRSLNEEGKCTILLVTHDPLVASTAKRVNFLKDGKIAHSFDSCSDPAVVSEKYLEVFG